MSYDNIVLLPSQKAALDDIIKHLPTSRIILLEGSAGTGKTTLTKCIVNYFNKSSYVKNSICAIAPTHKARRVIENVLNKNSLFHISTYTVASALSKIREHSYIGSKTFSQTNVKKLNSYNLILIDEVSMINDLDMKILLDYISKEKKMCILIGDSNQIPCPSSQYEPMSVVDNIDDVSVETKIIQKRNSFVFSDSKIYKITLKEVVRQALDSPIIRLAHHIKDNLNISLSINVLRDSFLTSEEEPHKLNTYKDMFIKHSDMYSIYKNIHDSSDIINKSLIRIIAYTNSAVRTHNMEIRRIMGYEDSFVIGDVMMGYTNIGYPELIIENGQDYVISDIALVSDFKINQFELLKGYLISLNVMNQEYFDSISSKTVVDLNPNIDVDTKTITIKNQKKNDTCISPSVIKINNLFFIDIYAEENYNFIKELIKRALKVNTVNSTKRDYVIYKELKDRVLFIEDIYFYNKNIYTETTIKENHPLLFTSLTDLISPNGDKKSSSLYDKIEKTYPGLIELRLSDNKLISDNEMLADKYKVIEKDIYYGYAITSHKSQGSTYNSVIVDEFDFNKITNKWNYKYGALENRIKEKNQLRYVAYTRAKEKLFIVCLDEE